FDAATGTLLMSLLAYDRSFRGGVRVAVGDVDGDGVPDVVTAPGAGGGPHVEVFSGQDGHLIRQFYAYDPKFAGGVTVAAGDLNGDGHAEVITGVASRGAPQVTVFDGAVAGAELVNYNAATAAFLGGVRVAAADVDGDGKADLITAIGPGG